MPFVLDKVVIEITAINTFCETSFPSGFTFENCFIVGATIQESNGGKYSYPGFGQSAYNLQTMQITDNGISVYTSNNSYVGGIVTIIIGREL